MKFVYIFVKYLHIFYNYHLNILIMWINRFKQNLDKQKDNNVLQALFLKKEL